MSENNSFDDFLGGMGFDAPAPTPIVSKKIEPTSTPNETIVHDTSEPKVDKKSYVDAVVIRSPDRVQRPNQSRPNPGANQSRPNSNNSQSRPTRPNPGVTQSRTFVSSRPGAAPQRSNISFGTGTARPPEQKKTYYAPSPSAPARVFRSQPKSNKRPTVAVLQALRKEKELKTSDTLILKKNVVLPTTLTLKEFSEKIGVSITELVKKFIANKMLMTMSSSIDFDTASLIAAEFEVTVMPESSKASMQDLVEGNLQSILESDKLSEYKIVRPPIVTIMGHVDHGKTTLLDYIRKTKVVNKEAGGITQSIGASQIVHNGKKMTFIDTPGHELFTSLRARGSKVTDIVVIVAAADDGIMKQTVEAINHAKSAQVPIIVAITKIDRGIDNTEKIKQQLSEHGLICEDWGGDIPLIKVSGISGQGVDELLESIQLHAEMGELVFDPQRSGVGVVLESHKSASEGVIASVIMVTGQLCVGDIIWTQSTFGKIKRMLDWTGKPIKSAYGGDPVQILGYQDVPEAGRLLEVVPSEKEARNRIVLVQGNVSSSTTNVSSALQSQILAGEHVQLNVILKADSFGSLEALKYSIASLEMPETVSINIVHNDIGSFSQSDVDLAKTTRALMLGFNISISSDMKKKADIDSATIKNFDIIYELTDYVKEFTLGLVRRDPIEVAIGKLEVLAVFFRKGSETIFGGKVTEGEVRNGALFRIHRGDEVLQGKITSLQKEQQNVDRMGAGRECGMKARIGKKLEVGDVLEYYVME